jgi:peptidoglycan/xylan/chitin deacetylase (PgdA/CDA1 family)
VVRRISLSFDNGPEPGVTDFVLDTLASRDVRAAFFVVGSKLEHDESLRCARRAAREGHRVGNHTYQHRDPLGMLDPEASRAEIGRTQALLDGFVTERSFRAVGGAGREGTLGDHLLSLAARNLLHDLPGGAMAHLPAVLDRALDQGAHFSYDFPPSCVVLERGVPRGALDAYVRGRVGEQRVARREHPHFARSGALDVGLAERPERPAGSPRRARTRGRRSQAPPRFGRRRT